MSERDPAAARFAVISILRLMGVAMVLGGVVIVSGNSSLPQWAGWVLVVIGMGDTFIVPQMLARRWRTPPE
ncbi:MAG: hypothetical protein IE933_04810 [Sphingomonadales bacterium]|nr:hypothetical protein [Sphingomonadales bacterium]MBD3773676.1 hypothetical protein [Paracoccaceae bacterium]